MPYLVHLIREYWITDATTRSDAETKALTLFNNDKNKPLVWTVEMSQHAKDVMDKYIANHSRQLKLEAKEIARKKRHKEVTVDDVIEAEAEMTS